MGRGGTTGGRPPLLRRLRPLPLSWRSQQMRMRWAGSGGAQWRSAWGTAGAEELLPAANARRSSSLPLGARRVGCEVAEELLPTADSRRSTSLPLGARQARLAVTNLPPQAGNAAKDLARGSVRPPSLRAATGHNGGPYSPVLPSSPCGGPPPSSRRWMAGRRRPFRAKARGR
jgi:hypothetical protein